MRYGPAEKALHQLAKETINPPNIWGNINSRRITRTRNCAPSGLRKYTFVFTDPNADKVNTFSDEPLKNQGYICAAVTLREAIGRLVSNFQNDTRKIWNLELTEIVEDLLVLRKGPQNIYS